MRLWQPQKTALSRHIKDIHRLEPNGLTIFAGILSNILSLQTILLENRPMTDADRIATLLAWIAARREAYTGWLRTAAPGLGS